MSVVSSDFVLHIFSDMQDTNKLPSAGVNRSEIPRLCLIYFSDLMLFNKRITAQRSLLKMSGNKDCEVFAHAHEHLV